MNRPDAITIRSRILGVLIRDARQASAKSAEECARAMGVSPATFAVYEAGEQAPSLPELEALAFYLKIMPEHFWQRSLLGGKGEERKADPGQMTGLRQRMIGALLRKARQDAGQSLEALALRCGMSALELDAYELGEKPLPLPQLETLAVALEKPIQHFLDRSGPVGAWSSQQRVVHGFLDLTPEMQEFVSRPVNQPYLELAMRLSEMSVEKLRAVGEGILEITL